MIFIINGYLANVILTNRNVPVSLQRAGRETLSVLTLQREDQEEQK